MNRTVADSQPIRPANERARSIEAVLDSTMSPGSGGITLWRGSQLARGGTRTIETGFAPLSAELPGGGWPVGGLVELLAAQPGCGEMRLLAPALARTVSARRPLALVAPPQSPHATALASLGVPADALLWLRAGDTTEQERDAFGRWRAQSDEHARTVRELIWMWAVLELVGRQEPGEPGGSTRTH